MVGSPGTPYFICVKIKDKKDIEIFFTHAGAIPDASKFINTVVEKSGIEK